MKSQKRGNIRREAILAFVRLRWAEYQEAATIREIALAVNSSPAAVHRHVKLLAAQGLIERRAGSGRTIRPVQPVRGRPF